MRPIVPGHVSDDNLGGPDPQQAAVLVIDMQNDFGAPGGMFERAGIDISGIAAAADATRPVLRAVRDVEIPVVYLKMEHAPDLGCRADR